MVRLSDRRLWMVAGAVGAAILMGGTAVLAQAPAKTTAPAVNGAALSHGAGGDRPAAAEVQLS